MAAQHTRLLVGSPTAPQRMMLSNVQEDFMHVYYYYPDAFNNLSLTLHTSLQ